MHCDLEDCSEIAKVPGSSASMNSSSDIRTNNTNLGTQGNTVSGIAGHFVKKLRDFINVGVVNIVARGRGGLPCVLVAGVLIAGVLIAGVFMLKHIKLSHDGKVAGKVAVGASLSATADNNSSWLSPSGVFSFGFRKLENNDLENNDQFLLCIWFANIPNRTIVWYANGDSPAPEGSTVMVAKSELVLTSPRGERLWNQTIAGVVAHGVMHDTGNFVLENDKLKSLWETFKNPTDTMLPGQIIERGGKLFSRQSETNYARGRFQLEFKEDGNLVFSEEIPFCSTRTTNGDVPGSEGTKLVFNALGNFYILRNNTGMFNFTAEERPAKDFYLRSTLNFNGVLALYYLSKSNVSNVSWAQLWFEPHQVGSGAGDCAGNCSNCYLNVSPRLPCQC